MKKILIIMLSFVFGLNFAQKPEDEKAIEKMLKTASEIKYQTGKITFSTGNATLNVPKNFKFINSKDARFVLEDLWGNPADASVLGAILPEKNTVLDDNCWMFVVNYVEDGYVKDEDSEDIDYEELLTNMKTETSEANTERLKLGYPNIQLIGWASKPYYDSKLKVLHWAKELKFGNEKGEQNTLNYDLRVLGRKGMFNVSAVATIPQLNEVKASIPDMVKSIQYNPGFQYKDFDEENDHVAEWTIGGLVAGKVLAKVGFFAVIAKFGKVIVVALLAGFAALRKFVFGGKKEQVMSKNEVTEPTETPKDENS
jgi:uncharacterized membrane-anchored protein